MSCQVGDDQPNDNDNSYTEQHVVAKKRRCILCDEGTAFSALLYCFDCAQVHLQSLHQKRVAINKLSGEPALSHLPTIRGDMPTDDVKQIYMIGVGKVNPEKVKLVPVMPSGFGATTELEGDQPVGLYGEEVHCIALP